MCIFAKIFYMSKIHIFHKQASLLLLLLACIQGSVLANGGEAEGIRYAPLLTVKSSALSTLLLTPNLSVEVPVMGHWTVDLTTEYNNWDAWGQQKWRHWTLQPEARYWWKEPLAGLYGGVHLLMGEYNIGNWRHQMPFFKGELQHADEYRFQGSCWGVGLGIGYAWQLDGNWGVEAELGMGLIKMKGDKFACKESKELLAKNLSHNYAGPTKAAVSVTYRIDMMVKPRSQRIEAIEQDQPKAEAAVPQYMNFVPCFVYVYPTFHSRLSPEEARDVLSIHPTELNLADFHTAAQGYAEGTEGFTQVYLTAVQVYPQNEAANLNAANACMAIGDMIPARRYLARAGRGKEAIYARALSHALSGKYDDALVLLHQAEEMGLPEAATAIAQLDALLKAVGREPVEQQNK